MTGAAARAAWRALGRFYSGYGMLAVLLALCAYFAWATYQTAYPVGAEGGAALSAEILAQGRSGARVVVVAPPDEAGRQFADALEAGLRHGGYADVPRIVGDPPAVRQALEARASSGGVGLVATTRACRDWPLFDALRQRVPSLAGLELRAPGSINRSAFLSASNLRNVADQIAVIAIIAVGMTMVIITGGIDLSVGSLVALSAVLTAWLIRAWGGTSASWAAMLAAGVCASVLCGLVGALSGAVITRFRVPPFIATLAVMQVASGLAFILAQGQSIYDIPASFTWLGRGATLASLPNAVVLMLAVYALAHVHMTRTSLGRAIYAVGGNPEAARLSGIRTKRVLTLVYLVSGLTAGIGGVITASQLKAGAPTYGAMYELYVIAAVVVGGTSLSGGEGRIYGTLIGALIIAVIRNGMNLTGVEPYTQKVILGAVILGAVLLDRARPRTASVA
jgi:ribose transport system permease protein